MNLIATIDFGDYIALKKLLSEPTFDPQSITHLDFSKGNYTDTPPLRALKLLPNLKSIDLSHNKINRFNPRNLLEGAPDLEELDFSHNRINEIEDLVDLGGLTSLKKLTFLDNPIAHKLLRIKLVEFLLLPSKYKPYTPIGQLTATYRYVSDKAKLDSATLEERKTLLRIIEREIEEIDPSEFNRTGPNKFDHRHTAIKLAAMECPVPRKTRFPMLVEMNKEKISVQDIRQIFVTEDIEDILDVPVKRVKVRKTKEGKHKLKGASGKLYMRHLEGYRRQKQRINEDGYKPSILDAQGSPINKKKVAEDYYDSDMEVNVELKVLMKKDKIEEIKKKKAKENYDSPSWRHPMDVEFKNAEYNIGITDHKKMIEDFEENKKALKEARKAAKREHIKKIRQEYRKKMERKANDQGKFKIEENNGLEQFETREEEESWHSFGSDQELKELFEYKKKKQKPNLQFYQNYTPVDSSESDLSEIDSDKEENVHAMQELLALGSFKEPDPNFLKPIELVESDGNEEVKTNVSAKKRHHHTKDATATPRLYQVRSDRNSNDMALSKHVSYENTPKDKGPQKNPTFRLNIPNRKSILRKAESIEVTKATNPESMKKLTTRFLVEKDPTPNIGLPGFKLKEKSQIEDAIEDNKDLNEVEVSELSAPLAELSRKASKEYLAAKLKTGEAKRISMCFPMDKDPKEAGWGNIIVENEFAQLSEASPTRKKPTLSLYHPNNAPESDEVNDDEIFNFVSQRKNQTSSKKHKQSEEGVNANDSLEVQSGREQFYSVQTDNQNAEPQAGSNELSNTHSSFDMEFIVALNPHISKTSSTVEQVPETASKDNVDLKNNAVKPLEHPSFKPSREVSAIKITRYSPNGSAAVVETTNQSTDRASSKPYSRPSTAAAQWNIHISSFSSQPSHMIASARGRIVSPLEFTNSTERSSIGRPQTTRPLTERSQEIKIKKPLRRKVGSTGHGKAKGPMAFQDLLDLVQDLERAKNSPKRLQKTQSIQSFSRKPSRDFKIVRKQGSVISQQSKTGVSGISTPRDMAATPREVILKTSKSTRNSVRLADFNTHNLSPSRFNATAQQSKTARNADGLTLPPNSFINAVDPGMTASGRLQGTLYPIGETDPRKEGNPSSKDPSPFIKGNNGKISCSDSKILIHDSESKTSGGFVPPYATQRLCVEDMIPTEKDGVSEDVKFKILNKRVPGMYDRILSTVERLNDFTQLIKEAEELPVKLKIKGYDKDEIKYHPKEIGYEQLAEFLRQQKGVDKLTFKDDHDLRKLIYLVNNFSNEGELRMTRIEVEARLRELKMKTSKAGGKELEWLLREIQELDRYWEIMEDLHLRKDSNNDPKNIEKLEQREVRLAENKAILTAHGLRLKKYYGEDYFNKYLKGMKNEKIETEGNDNNKDQKNQKKNNRQTEHLSKQDKAFIKKTTNASGKRSLADEIKKIEEDKRNALSVYPQVGSWNLKEGTEPCWIGGVERYIPEKILGLEEYMENIRIKKVGETYKEGRIPFTEEEELLNEVKNYKENKHKKRELKTRVDKYIKEAGKKIDEFLINEYQENDKRHDEKHMFRELMKAYYPIKPKHEEDEDELRR